MKKTKGIKLLLVILICACVVILTGCKSNTVNAELVKKTFSEAQFAPDIKDVLPKSSYVEKEAQNARASNSKLRSDSFTPAGTLVDVSDMAALYCGREIEYVIESFEQTRQSIEDSKFFIIQLLFSTNPDGTINSQITEMGVWQGTPTYDDPTQVTFRFKYEEEDGNKTLYFYHATNTMSRKLRLSIYADESYEICENYLSEGHESINYSYYKGTSFVRYGYSKSGNQTEFVSYLEFGEVEGKKFGISKRIESYGTYTVENTTEFLGDDYETYLYDRHSSTDSPNLSTDSFALIKNGMSMTQRVINKENNDTSYILEIDIQGFDGIKQLDIEDYNLGNEEYAAVKNILFDNGVEVLNNDLHINVEKEKVLEVKEEPVYTENGDLLFIMRKYDWTETGRYRGKFHLVTSGVTAPITDIESAFDSYIEELFGYSFEELGLSYSADFDIEYHAGRFVNELDNMRLSKVSGLENVVPVYENIETISSKMNDAFVIRFTGFEDANRIITP